MVWPGEPASTPLCTEAQRRHLAERMGGGDIAELDGITVYRAEHILHRLGADPADLYRDGRSPGGEQAPWAARFDL